VARALAVLAVLAALAACASAHPSGAAATACSHYASGKGSDHGSGSAAHPFRSLQRLVESLGLNGTGCILGGSVFTERVIVPRPVRLRTLGSATLVGGITIESQAGGTVVSGLSIRGYGSGRAAVVVQANDVTLSNNEITGAAYLNRNTACVFLDGTRGAVVDANRISDCSRTTKSDIAAPGVFVGSAYEARVTNNVIVDTPGYGIVLGPNAQKTRVVHNLVDGNDGSLLITGNTKTSSSNNVVENNILSNANGANVAASWTGIVGRGNAVVSNCIWKGAVSASGVRIEGNIVADPQYVSPPSNYTVQAAPCLAKRPSIISAHLARVPVTFHVRALPKRVQIVKLGLSGLLPGAHLTASCVSGCSTSWHATARGSTATITTLDGRWLKVGAAIEVHATLPGRAGASARIRIVGLPNGVSISHGCLTPGSGAAVSCGALP